MTDNPQSPRRAPWWDSVVSHAEELASTPPTIDATTEETSATQDPWRDVAIDKVSLSAQQQEFLGDDQPAPARLGSILAPGSPVDTAELADGSAED